MSDIINAFSNIPPEVWATILGAGGVSLITELLKRLLKLESEKVVQFLFAAVAASAAGLDYLLSSHNLPPTIIGMDTSILMGIATPLYFYFVKPLSSFVSAVKNFAASDTAKKLETPPITPQPAPAVPHKSTWTQSQPPAAPQTSQDTTAPLSDEFPV